MLTKTVRARRGHMPLSLLLGALALVAFVPTPALATSPNPYLVKNINPTGSSDPQQMVAVGDKVYFTADDGVHDRELWVSDGTSAGTHMVKDILTVEADYAPYWPTDMTPYNGKVIFSATDGVHGYEPWISDGTEAGTHMIKDIEPGTGVLGSDPFLYTEMNGVVYFGAATRASGREIWRTDGTDAGTWQVADLVPGAGGFWPEDMTVFNNKVYFVRRDTGSSNAGTLWRTDGTAAGTKAVRTSSGSKLKGTFNYGLLTAVGDHLYIGRNRFETWVTGGTAATTKKLVDFGTRYVVGVANTAYFRWEDAKTSVSPDSFLWKSDGTTAGTEPVKYADDTSIYPAFLTSFQGYLLFWGSDSWNGEGTEHTGGISLSDGTNAGTEPIGAYSQPTDIYSDYYHGTPRAELDAVLYYPAQTYAGTGGLTDVALWRTDGTGAGTYEVSPEYSSGILDEVTVAGNKIFFVTKAGKGTELWAYAP